MNATAPSARAPAPLMLSISGCRGVVGSSLTPEVVCRLAGALAGWLDERTPRDRPVVIGRDGRRGGEAIALLAAGALAACGRRVIDLGVATTPTVGVMVQHHEAAGGLIITASHNPAQWNGLKALTPEGSAPDASSAAQIIERFKAAPAPFVGAEGIGAVERDDRGPQIHVDRVLQAIGPLGGAGAVRARRFRVALDAVNCSGARPARLLLEALGCEVISSDDGSGVFPHTPEPTAANLAGFAAQVRALGADLGFAQDPDADRLAIIDADGRYVGEEYTLVLAAMALLGVPRVGESTRTVLAINLSTSRMLEDVAPGLGASVVRAAVGEANVVAAMRAHASPIGGEGNGGVIWPAVCWVRDSIGAMALVLSLLARRGVTLADAVGSIPRYAIVKTQAALPGPAGSGAGSGVISSLARAADAFPNARIDRQDGVRMDVGLTGGRSGWVHVRASNTEPIVRLIAEAPTEAEARALITQAAAGMGLAAG